MVQKVYGECCPVCQCELWSCFMYVDSVVTNSHLFADCMYEDKQYEDGDTFLDPSDPCYNCTCLVSGS